MSKLTVVLDENKSFLKFSDGTTEVQEDCSEALAWLASAVGLHEDMGPQEILEAILDIEGDREYWLTYYSSLMVKALGRKGTLGKGMFRAWEMLDVCAELGKAYVTKKSPRAAKYPYFPIYWNLARAEQLIGKPCKANYNVAESGALLYKDNWYHYVAGIAVMMERFAHTYTKIGAADVNKIKVLAEELLEEDIPWEIRNSLDLLLEPLEQLKTKPLKQQKEQLLKLAATIPAVGIL